MSELASFANVQILLAVAVFCRVGAFVALLPVIGERSVPARVKIAVTVALTLAIMPAVPQTPGLLSSPYLIATEIVAGAILGILVRMFVMILQVAGVIAAQATSLSQLLGNNGADPLPALGHTLLISGLALFAISGLHVTAIQFFVFSYDVIPMGEFPSVGGFSELGLQRASHVFSLALALAAPFVIVSVIYNVALGAINRAMPQLMVAFVGAPLITGLSLGLLLLCAPIIIMTWSEAFAAFLANPFGGF